MAKVYVLAHHTVEETYAPRVFTNKKNAQKALKAEYRQLLIDACDFSDDVKDKDLEEESFYVYSKEHSANFAKIVWNDNNYDRLDIFEVEVEDK